MRFPAILLPAGHPGVLARSSGFVCAVRTAVAAIAQVDLSAVWLTTVAGLSGAVSPVTVPQDPAACASGPRRASGALLADVVQPSGGPSPDGMSRTLQAWPAVIVIRAFVNVAGTGLTLVAANAEAAVLEEAASVFADDNARGALFSPVLLAHCAAHGGAPNACPQDGGSAVQLLAPGADCECGPAVTSTTSGTGAEGGLSAAAIIGGFVAGAVFGALSVACVVVRCRAGRDKRPLRSAASVEDTQMPRSGRSSRGLALRAAPSQGAAVGNVVGVGVAGVGVGDAGGIGGDVVGVTFGSAGAGDGGALATPPIAAVIHHVSNPVYTPTPDNRVRMLNIFDPLPTAHTVAAVHEEYGRDE
jgi:hypothetical protein